MKKRLLSVLLCMTMTLAPVVEIGAEAETNQSEAEETAAVPENAEETEDEEAEAVDEFDTEDDAEATDETETDEKKEISDDTDAADENENSDEEDFFGDAEEIKEESEEKKAETVQGSYGHYWVSVNDWLYDAQKDGWSVVVHMAEAEEPQIDAELLDAEEETETAAEEASEESTQIIEAEQLEAGVLTGPAVYTITTESESESHTHNYYINEEGFVLEGIQSDYNGDEYFFKPKAYAKKYDEKTGQEHMTPYNSDYLAAAEKEPIWDGNVFRFYGDGGELQPFTEECVYHFEYNDKEYKMHLVPQEDGSAKPEVGDYTDADGKEYHFDATPLEPSGIDGVDGIPGKMHTGWLYEKTKSGERWRFYTEDGSRKKPGITISKLDKNLNAKVVENAYYLLDADGYIIKNDMALAHNGVYYGSNKDGIIYRNKAVIYKGAMYYFDKSGKRVADKLIKYTNGYRYYFGKDGKRVSWKNEWHAIANGKVYYFGSAYGRVQEKKGWQLAKMNGKVYGWLYYTKAGEPYQDKLVNDYYFAKNCKLVGGKYTVNGLPYYFEKSTTKVHRGKMVKGKLIQDGNKYYGASSIGVLYGYNGLDKWAKLNNALYCFQGGTCEAYTKKYMQAPNGKYGYCAASGKWTTGWLIISDSKNQVRYIRSDVKGYYKNTTATIGGRNYRFDSNGFRVNDRSSEFSGPYYVKVDRVNCVMTVYTSSDMKTPVKSIRVSVGLPNTATPLGSATITRAGRWQMLMGPSWGQYACHVRGGIYIHSVACAAANSYNLSPYEYGRLGYPASHGCIRVCVGDAYWCYNNLPGSKINVFDGKSVAYESFKGPLGKPALTPMRGSMNFDPTDPNL